MATHWFVTFPIKLQLGVVHKVAYRIVVQGGKFYYSILPHFSNFIGAQPTNFELPRLKFVAAVILQNQLAGTEVRPPETSVVPILPSMLGHFHHPLRHHSTFI